MRTRVGFLLLILMLLLLAGKPGEPGVIDRKQVGPGTAVALRMKKIPLPSGPSEWYRGNPSEPMPYRTPPRPEWINHYEIRVERDGGEDVVYVTSKYDSPGSGMAFTRPVFEILEVTQHESIIVVVYQSSVLFTGVLVLERSADGQWRCVAEPADPQFGRGGLSPTRPHQAKVVPRASDHWSIRLDYPKTWMYRAPQLWELRRDPMTQQWALFQQASAASTQPARYP